MEVGDRVIYVGDHEEWVNKTGIIIELGVIEKNEHIEEAHMVEFDEEILNHREWPCSKNHIRKLGTEKLKPIK